jgi:hypothetical protein
MGRQDALGLAGHIVMGHDFATKVGNLVEAMRRGLLAPTELISIASVSWSS